MRKKKLKNYPSNEDIEYNTRNFEIKDKYGRPSLTARGEVVRSRGEKIIADYLFMNRINYGYELQLGQVMPDFYLPEFKIVIEYWGMAHAEGIDGILYRKKMNTKLHLYKSEGIKVISIFPEDLSNLQQKLSPLLRIVPRK